MEEKYFLHRIQEENGTFSKGIEVHDTMDAAILSFWGRMKLGYNNPQLQNMTFVSCKITDANGSIVSPYDMTWRKSVDADNTFFMHQIRQDGDSITKGIDAYSSFDDACRMFATAMEYGYNNPQHPNVSFVSCMITDISGAVLQPYSETWQAPAPAENVEE